ncbi:MAG: RluA family pseudouridine synthase [Pseudomonadales bacterium]|nr:RluA family pseudouridine synthase [Pseudomonadales bacterium]
MSDHNQVQFVRIEQLNHGQRLDNFLFRHLKGVPRSRIYRFIRRGEVRINKKRCKPESRLAEGDMVRIPPHEAAEVDQPPRPSSNLTGLLKQSVLYEDEDLLLVNKPAGLAVHGGSGIRLGLIEAVRQIDLSWQQAELAHRLDRDTSGCLVLCKNMSYLKGLQQQLKNKTVEKDYLALVYGQWQGQRREVDAPLQKNTLSSGERLVRVDASGKPSRTRFQIKQRFKEATLVQASPETGRTHQIRVHCQHAGHSIVGDSKYRAGDSAASESLRRHKDLCLHAQRIAFKNPVTGKPVEVRAALDERFKSLLDKLD